MTMFIHFFCLCPPNLTIKLNFKISKVAYSTELPANVIINTVVAFVDEHISRKMSREGVIIHTYIHTYILTYKLYSRPKKAFQRIQKERKKN